MAAVLVVLQVAGVVAIVVGVALLEIERPGWWAIVAGVFAIVVAYAADDV